MVKPLQAEMAHETICIPAVSPFFCRCSYAKTKEECFWAKISVETVAMQQHNTALIQSSNFTVWLLFFLSSLSECKCNAQLYSLLLYFLYFQTHNKGFIFAL